ncbi:MAG: sigma-54-dependent Fis family transcriptional regulator, partial [Myxococcales bacterium]|nr:sigma-54-dependent Fis family transcriptional regulator [Myxococcales bacterium]
MRARVLVVDDDPSMCDLLRDGLTASGFDVTTVSSAAEALSEVERGDHHIVITDLHLGAEDGLELCRTLNQRLPELPVVVVTAFGSMDAAIAAIRVGAYDFINKPVDLQALALVIDRGVAHYRLKQEVSRLRQQEATDKGFEEMVGDSRAMKKVYDLLSRLDGSDAPVLIEGESGTGKELVARALHQRSDYRNGPFVAINTAAVPSTLLESTLFGHVKGAFTDAKASRPGLFVEADGGTLFLDEIGEMPLDMQSKLLRVLQERKVRPVGGTTEVAFDTRIVSATNRDLEDAVHRGTFREDLYYRVAVVTVHVEPLRNRGKDVLLLAQHFLLKEAERANKKITGFSAEAARKLLDYDWPGNVRQLRNVVERAVALTRFEEISVTDLPDRILDFKTTQLVVDDTPDHMLTLEELERRYIERVLSAVGGNKTRAAKVLGVDRRTLYRKLER